MAVVHKWHIKLYFNKCKIEKYILLLFFQYSCQLLLQFQSRKIKHTQFKFKNITSSNIVAKYYLRFK